MRMRKLRMVLGWVTISLLVVASLASAEPYFGLYAGAAFPFENDLEIGDFPAPGNLTLDLNGLRAAIKHALPGLDIHVEGLGERVVLTGNVGSPIEAQQAFDIASRLVDDGRRVVNGIVAAETPAAVTVQTDKERVVLAKGDIEKRSPSPLSLMPDGLLQPLPADGVRDLIAYLMSDAQVPMP